MELSQREYASGILSDAKQFLQRSAALRLPSPFIFEFTGPPLSGKTTIIDGLDGYLRHHGFRVARPQEGAEVFRHIPRDTPRYNLTTAAYALRNVVEAMYDCGHDFVLLDRGLYDAHPWMQYWRQKGKLSESDARQFQYFFTHPILTAEIDICFFIFCSPEEAEARKQKSSPHSYGDEGGSYTAPESLRKLSAIFNQSCDALVKAGNPVIRIDTTHSPKPDMYDSVIDRILPVIEARVRANSSKFVP